MKQEIRFRGLSFNRNEHDVQNGELALCAGVELHDGTLRPSVLNGTSIANGADFGGTLLFVHKTPTYTHYIGKNTQNKLIANYADSSTYTSISFNNNPPTAENILQISAVGNTLVILYGGSTNPGLHYFLYNGTNYKYLGQQPPFINLQFRLVEAGYNYVYPEHQYRHEFSIAADEMFNLENQTSGVLKCPIKEEYQSMFTEAAYSLINKMHSDIVDDNNFYAPFFVRYCYRLYDGSCIMHSAPVYMPVGMPYQDLLHIFGLTVGVGESPLVIKKRDSSPNVISLVSTAAKLEYKYLSSNGALNTLNDDWSDIVTSIDIYISPQIAKTKQGELFSSVMGNAVYSPHYTFRSRNGMFLEQNYIYDSYGQAVLPASGDDVFADMPFRSDEEITTEMFNPVFYKIWSIQIGSSLINDVWAGFPLKEGTIKNLTSLDKMKNDDYKTHNKLLPDTHNSGLYLYNKRLHLYGIKETLFEGFSLQTMQVDCSTVTTNDPISIVKIVVYLSTTDGKKKVVMTTIGYTSENILQKVPLFYPDNRAYKMSLSSENENKTYSFNLRQSSTVNGAFTNPASYNYASGTLSDDADDEVPELSKLYVSEVDNPFYFPPGGRNTIGVGEIKGLATVTAAISPGQYGHQDLIVFCSDGIWTLTVTREGSYSEVHTLSRDVCVNPKSICQLDQSVLFSTDRALARLTGQTVASCTDMLDGPVPNLGNNGLLTDFYALFGQGGDFDDQNIKSLLDYNTHPLSLLQGCIPLYDFANSRVIMLPSGYASEAAAFPVYVFSLSDGAWSTMLFPRAKAAINSYPSPYVQLYTGAIKILDKAYDNGGLPVGTSGTRTSALIVTRTLTFESSMKVIQGFEQIHDIKPSYQHLTDSAGHLLYDGIVSGQHINVYTTDDGETWKNTSGTTVSPTNNPLLSPVMVDTNPAVILYGSNDNVTWQRIGYSKRLYESYLPGRPFRFFRVAIYMEMLLAERYSALLLDIIEKYRKL